MNNAAVSAFCPLEQLDFAAVERELTVNLRAIILTTLEFARRTVSSCGRIINISSYAAAKGGMESFTRSAALELLAADGGQFASGQTLFALKK